jgi:hypothetical protein
VHFNKIALNGARLCFAGGYNYKKRLFLVFVLFFDKTEKTKQSAKGYLHPSPWVRLFVRAYFAVTNAGVF